MSEDKDTYIAIDFDGTIVKHEFPEVGGPIPEAVDWIKKFKKAGVKIILFTMRSGYHLGEAVKYMEDNKIEPDGVNVNPTQGEWTSSPKAYAQLYIDDLSFGCPLVEDDGERPYVDWTVVGPEVMEMIENGDL